MNQPLNIPGYFPGPNPNKTTVNPGSVRVPVLNIVFKNQVPEADKTAVAAQQARDMKKMFAGLKDYYLENSYGKFFFDLRVKTVFMDEPRDFMGNRKLSDSQLVYVNDVLSAGQQKEDLLPLEKNYTGFNGGIIEKIRGTNPTHFRNYNKKAEFNFCLAALRKMEAEQIIHPWDDQLSFAEWLNFGLPPGESDARIYFTSASLAGGQVAGFGTYNALNRKQSDADEWGFTPLKLNIAGRTLKSYIWSQLLTDDRSAIHLDLFVHELGHTLGIPDMYNTGAEGFLGDGLSMMSFHSTSVMVHFDGYNKHRLRWIEPQVVVPAKQPETKDLAPVYENPGNALMVYPDSIGRPGEFFIIESRNSGGHRWDGTLKKYDEFLANDHKGIYIYQVNAINPSAEKPRVDVEGDNVITGTAAGMKVFNATTRPLFKTEESKFYDQEPSGLQVRVKSKTDQSHRLEITWNFERGTADFNGLSAANQFERIRSHKNWRKTWNQIVPGAFGGSSHTDLLFYDRDKGEAEFYKTDGAGNIIKLGNTFNNWRKTWDLIVPGAFGGSSHTDLLFYDRARGEAELYKTDGAGNIIKLGNTFTNWRKTWNQIVPGAFGGSSHTDLLFYDRARGEAEFYKTDGAGNIIKLGNTFTNWRKTWDVIVAGDFGGSSHTDLLFYDRARGEAEFYKTDGAGNIIKLGNTHTNWRKTWSLIVPFKKQGATRSGLLFYDNTKGEIEIYETTGTGDMTRINLTSFIRKSWDFIVPGVFSDRKIDFLFYDRGL